MKQIKTPPGIAVAGQNSPTTAWTEADTSGRRVFNFSRSRLSRVIRSSRNSESNLKPSVLFMSSIVDDLLTYRPSSVRTKDSSRNQQLLHPSHKSKEKLSHEITQMGHESGNYPFVIIRANSWQTSYRRLI